MTISTAPTPLSYSGNGSTTAFPITWKYNAKSHIVATLRSSNGTETTWALTTNYTLTDPGDTGTLTAVVAPATGETLVISLEPPNTQSSDFPLGGEFPSVTVEDGLDLAAQRDQKIQSLFDRSLRVPRTDTKTGSALELPIDTSRAGKYLAFDADGDPIASAAAAGTAVVSTFMETVLDDADADAAIETLADGATAETSPAVGDFALISDISANDGRKVTIQNLFNLLLSLNNTWSGTQTMSGKSMYWAKGADIVSAATLPIGSDGNMFDVTGSTGPITAMTVPAGMLFMLQFDSTPVLTHHATNLNLPGGANITAKAGDRAICFATAANQVHVLSYTAKPGEILQVVNTQTGAVATGTTTIPVDDTIPQNTEGDQYMSLAITPKSSTSKLKIDVVFYGQSAAGEIRHTVALFQDTTADALAAMSGTSISGTGSTGAVTFSHYMTSGTTSSTTFKIRAGLASAGTLTFNGSGGARIYGGVLASSITITEIAA